MATTYDRRLDALFQRRPDDVVRNIRETIQQRIDAAPKGVVLYGAGHYGRIAREALARRGVEPVAFVDANPDKRGTTVDGIPVLGIQDLQDGAAAGAVLVVTVYNCVDVLRRLAAMGFEATTYAQAAIAFGEPLVPYCGVCEPALLWEHESEIRAAMALWADDASREEYLSQLEWSTNLDPHRLAPPRPASETYFDRELVSLDKNSVFVDCGAFDGDSVAAFIERCPDYDHIVALEPDSANRDRFVTRFGSLDGLATKRITLLPFAVSDRRGVLTFSATGTAGSAISPAGARVDAAPLDDILHDEAPTLIKMDIEGAEPLALRGAQRLIRQHAPALAVCLYHSRAHLWQLPLFLATTQPGYALRLRRYADECWELICYASAANVDRLARD